MGSRLYGLEERLDPVHVGVDDLGVAGSKAIGESGEARAVGVNDNEEVDHGIECNTMDPTEEVASMTHVVADAIDGSLLERVERRDALKDCVLSSGVIFLRIRPHILNPSRSYTRLWRKMLRTLSSRRPDMSRRRRMKVKCSVTGRVFVKLVTPMKYRISNQAWMRAWKMGKGWRSPFQASRKKLSEVWCPPAG